MNELKQAIENRTAKAAVIGLGYVGLPVACLLAKSGFQTSGVDVDQRRIEKLNRGENPIEGIEPGLDELVAEVISSGNLVCTTDYNYLREVDMVLICVQTPVDDSDNRPRYAHLRSALGNLGAVLKQGALVIVESTLAPGTMHKVVLPELEKATGGKAGEYFFPGHCPERVMPGRLIHNLTNLDRVVGGQTPEVAETMVALYQTYVQGALDPTDMLTAELVKTTENAYRDVQIAFANEVARICEALGGDVWKVRELVNKSPGRQMLYPGAGVGGHCIPKDPWLLIANVADEVQPTLIPTARSVNRFMPEHVANLTEKGLGKFGVPLNEATIAVLGYAYLENSDDTRDTPSQTFIEIMQTRGANLRIHDPFVEPYQTDLDVVLEGAHAAVILVAHSAYREADWSAALGRLKTPVLVDARHVLPDSFSANGAYIRILGQGHKHD